MRRTLASALVAAALLAAQVLALVLFLNPSLRLRAEPGLGALFAAYVALGFLALSALAGLGSLGRFRPSLRPPRVPGWPWLVALSATALAAAALLFAFNLLAYRHALPEASVRGLLAATVVLAGAVVALLAVGLDAWLFPLRSRRLPGTLALGIVVCAAAAPWWLRPGRAAQPQPPAFRGETVQPLRRVVLMGADGLGPDAVEAGLAKGHLPELARLLKRGAAGPLATLRPTEGPPVWTTIFTGRYPRDHGVKSLNAYRLVGSTSLYELLPKGALVGVLERVGLAKRVPVTPGQRRCRALWEALNAFGIPVGIVRFWGTTPAEPVNGFMLGHAFHHLAGDPARAAEALYPRDMLPEVLAAQVQPEALDPALVGQYVDLATQVPGDTLGWERQLLVRALAPDLSYQRAGALLRSTYQPAFFATYFYGLDPVGHTFLRHAQPEHFGDVSAAAQRRYGKVWERYQAYISQSAGQLAQGLRPGEMLVLVSGYGMQPTPLWRRLAALGLGGETAAGTHVDAPDGFVLFVGDGIAPGARIAGASILDVAPTLLYLMGLPVARDMPGRVLAEIVDDSFARRQPVTYIPSYESLAVRAGPPAAAGAATPGEEEVP